MRHREPSDVAVMAARVARAYPTLSPYASARIATEFVRIGNLWNTHATRKCNGSPDIRRKPEPGELFGYVKLVPLPEGRPQDPGAPKGKAWVDDPDAAERAGKRITNAIGQVQTQLQDWRAIDSNGVVVLPGVQTAEFHINVRLPGEREPVAV